MPGSYTLNPQRRPSTLRVEDSVVIGLVVLGLGLRSTLQGLGFGVACWIEFWLEDA